MHSRGNGCRYCVIIVYDFLYIVLLHILLLNLIFTEFIVLN